MPMLPPKTHIGEYVLVRHVATGATSEVYEGRHVVTGQPVAVKVLYYEWCLQPEVVARFLNEATALRRLQHRRIVRALACGTHPEGMPFVILEWLPIDLHRVLARAGGALAWETAVAIAEQIAEALLALHGHGIVHRDLKPANVLFAREEESSAPDVKLADLGLAKVISSQSAINSGEASQALQAAPISTAGSALLGTWDYMAPEQWIRSKNVDPKADVYSLGVLLFQMLAGKLPFVAEEQKDLMYLHLLEPPPVHLLDDVVPSQVRELVTAMMSKKPQLRLSMPEVMAQLSELK